MLRQARIDAPGALHHIICRGIERRKIFDDDADHDNFWDSDFVREVLAQQKERFERRYWLKVMILIESCRGWQMS